MSDRYLIHQRRKHKKPHIAGYFTGRFPGLVCSLKFVFLTALLCSSPLAWASNQTAINTNIPEIGPHQPILRLEKSENPQNIMIIYTKLDSECKFIEQQESSLPILDFYWMMDRNRYKPVNSLIKSAARKRFEIINSDKTDKPNVDSFQVRLKQLQDLQLKIDSPALLQIDSRKENGKCVVSTSMKLNADSSGSGDEKTMVVDSIFTESKKTMLPPFRKMVAVTLKGNDAETGKDLQRKFSAK